MPLPATSTPPSAPTIKVPCATDSVVVIAAAPASGSETARPAIARLWPASTFCVTGMVFTGASLTLVTESAAIAVLLCAWPSLTDTSRWRSAVEGFSLVLLNITAFSAA